MKTKLTLTLDKEVIEKAKLYASKANQSVSSLVENYLNQLGADAKDQEEDLHPIIKKWKGCLSSLPENIDYKEELSRLIHERYWSR